MIEQRLQRELRERFNPDGSLLRKQQLRMLEILLYVDRVCKEHNIRYWLSSGTLLGAVRHGGFIPWDDDLDIEMLREDYDRFIKAFKDNDDFALQTHKNDKYFLLPFAKIRDKHTLIEELGNNENYKHRGIFIDVFCLEESPRFAYVAYGVWLYMLQRLQKRSSGKLVRGILYVGKKLFYGSIVVLKPLLKCMPCKRVHHAYGCGPRWRHRDMEDIMPLGSVEFEGYHFPAPCNCDAYLRRMFGDYSTLPDLERLRVHISNCTFEDPNSSNRPK